MSEHKINASELLWSLRGLVESNGESHDDVDDLLGVQ